MTSPVPRPAPWVAPPEHIAVSQLIWRALGPLGGRARAVTDWAGLTGPATQSQDVARNHDTSTVSLRAWTRLVRHAAGQTELDQQIVQALTRRSDPGEDHLARVRQAFLTGHTEPLPPAALTRDERLHARPAQRILAVLGPITVRELTAALRQQQERHSVALTTTVVRGMLLRNDVADIDDHDRCHLTRPVTPAPRDVALLGAGRRTGRTRHTTAQMHQLLLEAGYTGHVGPTLARHPLLIHLDYGHWEIRTPAPTPTPAPASPDAGLPE